VSISVNTPDHPVSFSVNFNINPSISSEMILKQGFKAAVGSFGNTWTSPENLNKHNKQVPTPCSLLRYSLPSTAPPP